MSSPTTTIGTSKPNTINSPKPFSPSLPKLALSQTLTSMANLANLLSTLLAFQILTPIFNNNDNFHLITYLLIALLLLLTISCLLASFTDIVKVSDRKVYPDLANFKGMWIFIYTNPSRSGLPNLSNYRVRFIDFVHTLLSILMLLC